MCCRHAQTASSQCATVHQGGTRRIRTSCPPGAGSCFALTLVQVVSVVAAGAFIFFLSEAAKGWDKKKREKDTAQGVEEFDASCIETSQTNGNCLQYTLKRGFVIVGFDRHRCS